MGKRAILALAAFAFGLLAQPAIADRLFKATIRAVTNEPFRITACSGSVGYTLSLRASYENNGQKPIKAIKVRFVLEDDFDAMLEQHIGLDGDGMNAGKSSHGSWGGYIATSPGSEATELVCEAYAAKFTDGTTWEASPGAASPPNGGYPEQPKLP